MFGPVLGFSLSIISFSSPYRYHCSHRTDAETEATQLLWVVLGHKELVNSGASTHTQVWFTPQTGLNWFSVIPSKFKFKDFDPWAEVNLRN